MPDESCRNCGGILVKCTLCAQCKQVISMICNKCGTRTKEQFHDNCIFEVEKIQKDSVVQNSIFNASPKTLTMT